MRLALALNVGARLGSFLRQRLRLLHANFPPHRSAQDKVYQEPGRLLTGKLVRRIARGMLG
jgi:hypothetical protein